jgi:hypothetical protein
MEIDTEVVRDKLIINFKPMLARTTRMEMGLVTDNLKAQRPVRNVTDTTLDDILYDIKDLQKIDPKRYEEVMEHIIEARTLNNIVKTVENSVDMKMADIYYTLASAELVP